jgi:hypothetical protein
MMMLSRGNILPLDVVVEDGFSALSHQQMNIPDLILSMFRPFKHQSYRTGRHYFSLVVDVDFKTY